MDKSQELLKKEEMAKQVQEEMDHQDRKLDRMSRAINEATARMKASPTAEEQSDVPEPNRESIS